MGILDAGRKKSIAGPAPRPARQSGYFFLVRRGMDATPAEVATAGPPTAAGAPRLPARARGGDSRGAGVPFLAEATRALASSAEVEETLAGVARLSLAHLGSWCFVDLCEDDQMRRVAVIHPDPARERLAAELLAGWPPLRDDPLGGGLALRTGRGEVVAPLTDAMLVQVSASPRNLEILRELETGSAMTVPLLARGQVLGAITWVSGGGEGAFSADDLAVAEDLAARCALAADNARLFSLAGEARAQAEAAQQRAEEANLTKARFLATMSHELRTPLNAIGGYADLLESGVRGALSEAQLADVRRIQVNRRHLLRLVESVLSYTGVSVARVETGLGDVALADVLHEADAIIAPLAEEKGIACRGLHPDEASDLSVYADAEKLVQILVNLLSNAITFTPAGGRIDVTFHPGGSRVEIRVADTGIGIAPEQLARIFEPFVQVDESLTRSAEGTGLGLAISRELAVAMGGSLTVASEPGRGATFTLALARGRG